ncbi:hypothetical protein LWF01_02910 [Saxibacter everestensis]|uniref:Terminase small subunit n=1 Tax=Saxibacter everestensis TaxID=2909229 RepID=A0ABY8QUN3_9MICO|nr:hypothetical protein LWF01_02910 [Brevibacteriaceae bacterium ZFBP1038]
MDAACAQAARDQKTVRVDRKAAETAEVVQLAIAEALVSEAPVDELVEARENLRIVKATMRAGVPTGMAALSKQYADLVALVKRLESQSVPGVSVVDQLAQRRAERLAASSD